LDRNLFLAFALSFAVLTGWMLLMGPKHHQAVPAPTSLEQPAQTPPAVAQATQAPTPASRAPSAPAAPSAPEAEPTVLRIERPQFIAELTTRGAALQHFELRNFDTGRRAGQRPIVLTGDAAGESPALLTPLEELGLGSLAERNFAVESSTDSAISFRFEAGGLVIHKTYEFQADGYLFALRLAVENGSNAVVKSQFGVDWPVVPIVGSDFKDQTLAALFEGSVKRVPIVGFGKPSFFNRNPARVVEMKHEIDWAGVDVSYFLRAMLPDQPALANARFETTDPGHTGLVQVFFDPVEIPSAKSAERMFRIYAGPKQEKTLEALGAGLIRAINLGYTWVVPLTRFFHWLLQALYSVIPNYGVAIILLTLGVRIVTSPLTSRQMRSMERMRALAPRLEELKAKFADDKAKQSEEMMKLYRQEGVNPLGGCLPMVLQIPVFIGLFYALQSSIELRHSPFFAWITDLSVPESLFTIPGIEIPVRVLPLLMGASMVVQQKLTPMQADPAQARMMMVVMPVMMTVMFYQFPSGLVLYWMVSNVIAIANQLWVGRRLRAKA
jgi:YidC/Oxa1 family membrane protein insertase